MSFKVTIECVNGTINTNFEGDIDYLVLVGIFEQIKYSMFNNVAEEKNEPKIETSTE